MILLDKINDGMGWDGDGDGMGREEEVGRLGCHFWASQNGVWLLGKISSQRT